MDYCEGRVNNASNKDESENNMEEHWTYEVDTVQHDGTIQTDMIPCYGAGTLGTVEGKDALLQQMIPHISSNIKLIGVGVTEAGLSSSSTKAVKDLYDILKKICQCRSTSDTGKDNSSGSGRISVINTDNIPHNGDLLQRFLMELAEEEKDDHTFKTFLEKSVAFHNTMVDRITSQRPDSNGLVPRAEPTPAKALVIEDLKNDLPQELSMSNSKDNENDLESKYGVVVRTKPGQLNSDIALKLRVANGTHTAVAHVMALCQLLMTDVLSKKGGDNDSASTILMKFLDSFFHNQIAKGVESNKQQLISTTIDDAAYVYDDWRKRLIHAHFGLSSFFITQNGAAKGGIRIGPTVVDLLLNGQNVSCATVFALAAILRFLTPARPTSTPEDGVYRGWLDGCARDGDGNSESSGKSEEYADGLYYNLKEGWYEFRCVCNVIAGECEREQPLPVVLGSLPTTMQPPYYEQVIRAYLTKGDGGDLSKVADHPCTKDSFDILVRAVATVYARMIAGDGMLNILREMELESNCDTLVDGVEVSSNSKKRSNSHLDDYRPLHYRQNAIPSDSRLLNATLGDDRDAIRSVVFSEVQSALIIDLHTHLLPPSHGALCLWGIDELLTVSYNDE